MMPNTMANTARSATAHQLRASAAPMALMSGPIGPGTPGELVTSIVVLHDHIGGRPDGQPAIIAETTRI